MNNSQAVKLLESFLETICSDLSPDDVFSKDALIEYVMNNCNIDEVFSDDDILKHVKANFSLAQVFSRADLEEWAWDNDFERAKNPQDA